MTYVLYTISYARREKGLGRTWKDVVWGRRPHGVFEVLYERGKKEKEMPGSYVIGQCFVK